MAAAGKENAPVEQESGQIKNGFTNKEYLIAREGKPAVKTLAVTELSTLVKESLDDILMTWFHNVQGACWWVVYNVVEQVMLDLFLVSM